MAIDRFIYWSKGPAKDERGLYKRPTKKQVRLVLEDFFNGIGEIEERKYDFIITLPGKPSNPLKRIYDVPPEMRDERWIEVFVARTNIDIIIRQQDDFVNSLAEGLAEVFCRGFQGRRE